MAKTNQHSDYILQQLFWRRDELLAYFEVEKDKESLIGEEQLTDVKRK